MTLAVLFTLALLVIATVLLVAHPLSRPAPDVVDDGHEDLLAEREALLRALRDLDDQVDRGEQDADAVHAERSRLRGRAARVLAQLDALPPVPTRPNASVARPALLTLLVMAALVGVGALTVLPRWQLAGLSTGEAKAVQEVVQIPALRATATRTGTEASLLAWGRAAFAAGRYAEAAQAYASALKQNPQQPEALRRLGIYLVTQGDPKNVQQAFLLVRGAAQLAPKDPESQLFLGFALTHFGEDEAALKALQTYQKLDPSGRDADETITAIRTRLGQSTPGTRVYAASCASCHGPDGRGGIGPNLHLSNLTRAQAQDVILHGRGAMPAFPNLKGEELRGVLDLVMKWQAEP
ncbi:c-type cytochrome [Deinococcus maricopensis]|uniref:Cytochrome c class I n=1 Tax=Deinococcus maricopensis (strain DSM 21211 / LMG 22137 / NRRL B-23946 / LB-34) TaxID=709986 RepID=E8U6V9_DEIML|nr:c-type cytochrome [Deinococcus maricopensis]ADV66798.1 cytochrome c class I [Deinococcus maricopensis DSM 21211]